jgi:hypothetical protein
MIERSSMSPRRELLDAVQHDRPHGVEDDLLRVAVELSLAEAAAGRESAERVG